MNFLQLTEEKLDVNKVSDLVLHESCGAVSIFVGITRDNFEDKQVIDRDYSIFVVPEMISIFHYRRLYSSNTRHIIQWLKRPLTKSAMKFETNGPM